AMPDRPDDPHAAELHDTLRHLAATAQQIAGTLANLEALYAAELKRQEERQRQFAAEHAEFKERQKRSDERQDKEFQERIVTTGKNLSFIGVGPGRLTPL